MITEKEIEAYFLEKDLDPESVNYIRTHSRRFSYLIRFIGKIRKEIPQQSINILDIGPSFFTEILRLHFSSDKIHTLGFSHPDSRGGHFPDCVKIDPDSFYQFDLNNAQSDEKWISLPPMDLVVMGEVLEHLYTSPVQIFRFIKSFLTPGGFLILGTPNAAALQRRLKLLAGKNPYELIRETRDNPGHFREYTTKELRCLARQAGLETYDYEVKNYFKPQSVKGQIFDTLLSAMPPNFRTGINIVLRNPAT